MALPGSAVDSVPPKHFFALPSTALYISAIMDVSDVIPADGTLQRIYCERCGTHCESAFVIFDEQVSNVRIRIEGLPTLRCPACGGEQLPDLSRFAIIQSHKECVAKFSESATSRRRKRTNDFGYTAIKFLYDPDDYFYLPGLVRPWDKGFLQPVFFNRAVLLKYDNSPEYSIQFASTSYGTIYTGTNYISFGINRHGKVVMWLGDIAKLPETEQYYLRSENVESDHAIGSEFYDGQIEVKFTDLSKENRLFKARSDFLDACFNRLGAKIAHLDQETFELAREFNPPLVDTAKERHHVADALNKIYVESLDSAALEAIREKIGAENLGKGSLKRLQAILEKLAPNEEISALMSPLYVLYDLRVAYSHLTPVEKSRALLTSVCNRLEIDSDAILSQIYTRLIASMEQSFSRLTGIVKKDAAV